MQFLDKSINAGQSRQNFKDMHMCSKQNVKKKKMNDQKDGHSVSGKQRSIVCRLDCCSENGGFLCDISVT